MLKLNMNKMERYDIKIYKFLVTNKLNSKQHIVWYHLQNPISCFSYTKYSCAIFYNYLTMLRPSQRAVEDVMMAWNDD